MSRANREWLARTFRITGSLYGPEPREFRDPDIRYGIPVADLGQIDWSAASVASDRTYTHPPKSR